MGTTTPTTSETAHVSTILLEHTGIKEYEWTFNLHSRSVLHNNLTLGPSKMYEFKDMRFTTGVLGQLDHFWELKLFSNFVIEIRIWVKNRDDFRFKIHSTKMCLISTQIPFKTNYTFGMKEVAISTKKGYYMAEGTASLASVYGECVDCLRIILQFQCESNPKYIIPSRYCGGTDAAPATTPHLNAKKFLLNSSLSDVTLNCGGETFQAHRVVLACRSPVFQVMFETHMKEAKEGIVEIKDVDPKILKELLHFIYTDELMTDDMSVELCVELFKLAERYTIQPLKAKCAQLILKSTIVDNAMSVYMLGDMYNEEMLKAAAMDLIKRDRVNAMRDPKAFIEFANLYPEIAFDLLKT